MIGSPRCRPWRGLDVDQRPGIAPQVQNGAEHPSTIGAPEIKKTAGVPWWWRCPSIVWSRWVSRSDGALLAWSAVDILVEVDLAAAGEPVGVGSNTRSCSTTWAFVRRMRCDGYW